MSIVIATAGPITLTGIITETNLAALRIPGGTIGRNGLVEVRTLWAFTNSANNKQMFARFNATAGATTGNSMGGGTTVTTTATSQLLHMVGNSGATNAQATYSVPATAPYGASASALQNFTVDTTVDSWININGVIAAAGETLTLQHAAVVVFPSP